MGRLAGGAFFWSDFIYDDNGAFGAASGNGESAGSPTGGTYSYPHDPAPEALAQRNGADLFRIGIGVGANDSWWRIDWNTLVSPDVPIAVFGLDTDDSAATGTPTWPAGAGVRSAGLDAALIVSGAGAWLVTGPLLSQTTSVSALGGAHSVDMASRSFVVRLPRAALAPSGTWRVRVVSGLADASGQAFAAVPPERGALVGQPAVYNAGYRTFAQEEGGGLRFWQDGAQGQALAIGDVSAFSAVVDWAQLEAQVNEPEPLPTGLSIRWYVSSLELGQGKALDVGTAADHRPNYIGRVQPYTVYVPTTYQPNTPAPLTWLLHSYTQNHNQYLVSNPNFLADACEARGSICATPLGRGPDMFYLEEAQLDFFEVWNRVAAAYSLDPERTVISGYSMGGYGTYLLAMLYPELFARAVVLAGPPGCGGLEVVPGMPLSAPGSTCEAAGPSEPMLPNLRWLPTYLAHGGADQLAPIAATQAQVDALDALGLRYRFDLHPAEDHVGFVVKDGFAAAAEFMGSAPRAIDPGRIDYIFEPVVARPDLGFAPAGAWWVQEAVARDASLRTASIQARSLADPDPDIAELVRSQTAIPDAEPSPAVRRELDWVLGARPPAEPSAVALLANIGSLALDLARAGLIAAGTDGDADGDGIADAGDNCALSPNPLQEDSGGVASSAPDGIGDACQCGDVSGNGMVNGQDANAIRRHGLGADPNPTFRVLFHCDVSGNGSCDGQDGNAVTRASLGLSPNPLFRNGCASYTGARSILIDTDGPSNVTLAGLVPGTEVFLDGAPAGVADGDGRAPLAISTGIHEIFVVP